jgi:hypothetical protein
MSFTYAVDEIIHSLFCRDQAREEESLRNDLSGLAGAPFPSIFHASFSG